MKKEEVGKSVPMRVEKTKKCGQNPS